MNFIDANITYFKRIFDFKGRSSRSEYWWAILGINIISSILTAIIFLFIIAGATETEYTNSTNAGIVAVLAIVTVFLTIILSIPYIALSIRRFHDAGYKGLWFLISFIPFGNYVVLAMNGFLQTQQFTNEWGEIPSHAVTTQQGVYVQHNEQYVYPHQTQDSIYNTPQPQSPYSSYQQNSEHYIDFPINKPVPPVPPVPPIKPESVKPVDTIEKVSPTSTETSESSVRKNKQYNFPSMTIKETKIK